MKIKLFLFLLITVLLPAALLAKGGEIWGYVYNGTEDSTTIANTEVQFLVYQKHTLIDDSSYVLKTNSQGMYHLTNIPVDSTLIYYPRVDFHSIVYYGKGVIVTPQNNKQQSHVVVYDTTSDKKHIAVQMEHLFIIEENGKIIVREIYLILNTGKRTYLGKKIPDTNHHHVLEFPLPEGYENVELLTPDAQNSVVIENDFLIDMALFPPGSRQLSFQLQIPHKGKEWHYTRPLSYPTGSINIFLSQPELTLEGPGIVPMGDFSIRNTNYQRFAVQHLMPGMQLDITLKNLPRKSIPIQLIVLGIVAVFLLVGFGYTLLKKKQQ